MIKTPVRYYELNDESGFGHVIDAKGYVLAYEASGRTAPEVVAALNESAKLRELCQKLLKALEIECSDPELGTARIIGEARKLLNNKARVGEGE
jgi:hypothetical protein